MSCKETEVVDNILQTGILVYVVLGCLSQGQEEFFMDLGVAFCYASKNVAK